MGDDMQQKIRQRAYELWEQEGQSGDPHDHWLKAEHEITRKTQGAGSGAAVAQVGNEKVPRPQKVSGRSVPDDVHE